MGMIIIKTMGSFGEKEASFNAESNGHASAVAEAIGYLARSLLPWSIARDHRLQAEGEEPNEGWYIEPVAK